MNKNILLVICLVAIIIVVGGYFLFQRNLIQSPSQEKKPITLQGISETPISKSSSECVNQKEYKNLADALKEPEQVCKLSLGGKALNELSGDVGKLKNLRELILVRTEDASNITIFQLPPEIEQLTCKNP